MGRPPAEQGNDGYAEEGLREHGGTDRDETLLQMAEGIQAVFEYRGRFHNGFLVCAGYLQQHEDGERE